MKLTQRTYPVSWEMGDLVLDAKLVIDDEGYLERWNGFLVPWFTREEVQRYGDYVEGLDADQLLSWIEWDQDVLIVHHDYAEDDAGERIVPVDGLYPLGDGWTWQLVERLL